MNKLTKYRIEKALTIFEGTIKKNRVNVHWWRGRKNFGDLVTKELFKHFGCTPVHAYDSNAQVIGAGSLLQGIPEEFNGDIIGTGLIKDDGILNRKDFSGCRIHSVRGELTKKILSLPNSVQTGDLGLIAHNLINGKKYAKKYVIGLIPHYVDKSSAWINAIQEKFGDEYLFIDVENSATHVINEMKHCEVIISSSLHGILCADALGIPNIWCELSKNVVGDGFKFHDYNSSIDYEQKAYSIDELGDLKNLEQFVSNKNLQIIMNKQNEIENLLLICIQRLLKQSN